MKFLTTFTYHKIFLTAVNNSTFSHCWKTKKVHSKKLIHSASPSGSFRTDPSFARTGQGPRQSPSVCYLAFCRRHVGKVTSYLRYAS